MTTTTALLDPDPDVTTARRWEDASYLHTWLRRWLALLVVAALATIGFLIAIDVALANVDSSIGNARDQAVGVARNTGNLPFLLAQMTQNLERIDAAQKPIPANELQVARTLAQTNQHLVTNVHNNAVIKNNQQTVDNALVRIQSTLSPAEQRLAQILQLNTAIRDTLAATERSTSAGARGLILKTAAINATQRAAMADSGDILHELTQANRHLTSICTAPLMQTLGVFPPC
jgi:hypothetical protein